MPLAKAKTERVTAGQILSQESLKDRWSPPDSFVGEGMMQSFGDNIEESQYDDARFRLYFQNINGLKLSSNS